MALISAYAHAKLILLGEHAVVYGEPSIAMPLLSLHTRVIVEPLITAPSGTMRVYAPFIGLDHNMDELPQDNLVAYAIRLVLEELGIDHRPTCTLRISSDIPVSSGLGASAALSVAVMRGFSAYLGHPIESSILNRLAFQTETVVHGTPSGIDNTVVVYERALYFQKETPLEFLQPAISFHFIVADSGIKKSTASTVRQLAIAYQENPEYCGAQISLIGECTQLGRHAIESGNTKALGEIMNRNQELLSSLDLSCPELDNLQQAALHAGAFGAKLTGGGKGGHLIALVDPAAAEVVTESLVQAGAVNVTKTTLPAGEKNIE